MNTQYLKNKNIIIVHGYTASPQSHWFIWLKKELEEQGAVVHIPAMPNSSTPDPVEWLQHLENLSLPLDSDTIFIGHSLGCITLLRFLDKHKNQLSKIGGYILVSGFAKTLNTILSLKAHTDCQLDYEGLKSITNHRVSIISTNDAIVETDYSLDLANLLHAKVLFVENAGHFLDRDGYKEFPDILSVLQEIYS